MKNKLNLSKIVCYTLLLACISMTSCANSDSSVFAQKTMPDNTNSKKENDVASISRTPTPDVSKKSKVAEPEIISRRMWKAKKPIGKGIQQEIKFITIHHSASAQKQKRAIEKKLQNLQNYSQRKEKRADGSVKPAWIDVPYHYYIAADGQIAEARQIEFAGDTNTNYDPKDHALIVLEGNFENEKPTAEQIESMKILTAWLANKFEVTNKDIKAHDDYASTACPGKNLKSLLPDLRESLVKTPNLKSETNSHTQQKNAAIKSASNS